MEQGVKGDIDVDDTLLQSNSSLEVNSNDSKESARAKFALQALLNEKEIGKIAEANKVAEIKLRSSRSLEVTNRD